MGEFGVSEGDVLFLFVGLSEGINDIAKDMQRTVDIAALSEAFSLNVSVLHSFTSCKVNDMEFGLLGFSNFLVGYFRFDKDAENRMGSRTLCVHLRGGHFSSFFPFQQQTNSVSISPYFFFDQPFDKDPFFGVFPDLVDALVRG